MNQDKVLVVDDEPTIIELISAYLEKDYSIIPANNGKEALEKIESENPDIVLLDIMMPDLSGFDLCKKIKEQDNTRFLPVVMITALSELNDKVKAIEAGADDFLSKPINFIELSSRVKSLLKTKYYQERLLESKKKIEAQNEFKTIIANLLPLLMDYIPPDKKKEVIWQMSKQVEDVIWTKYIHESPADIEQIASISCSIMKLLGGDFQVKKVNKKGYTIKNNMCPWGDYGSLNPVLCMLTKAIFTRTGVRSYRNISVDIKKTIAGGDGYCLIEAYTGEC